MKQVLRQVLSQTSQLTIENIILNLVVALIIAIVIYISYMLSHNGSVYSKKFNVSLIMLTLITSMIMTVIGNNVALSLGMVGALSIVRFRTAIKDSRDTAYIFWTVAVGICCGISDYTVAGIGTAIIFLMLLVVGNIKNDERILLIIRGSKVDELKVEGKVFDFFQTKADLKVKNTTKDSIEYIYEIASKYYDKGIKEKGSLTEELYKIKDVEYVNIVKQNDEISG